MDMVLVIIASSQDVVGCWNIIKEFYLYNSTSLIVFHNFLNVQHVLYLLMVNYRMTHKFIEIKIDPNQVAKYWFGSNFIFKHLYLFSRVLEILAS